MWLSIGRLKDGTALLRHYIDGLVKQDLLVGFEAAECGMAGDAIRSLQEHFRSKDNRAQFEYNCIIISLYGYLERFVEELIAEYLSFICGEVSSFDKLPETLRRNHLPLSLELARKVDYQQYTRSVRIEDLIAKLHCCFSSPDNYQLNVDAFCQHAANFRHSEVIKTLSNCGIANIVSSLRAAEPLSAFLKAEDPERNERELEAHLSASDGVLFARVDDLANRRNDVSHGTPSDNILSREFLRNYIEFIEAYAESLALVAYESSLAFLVVRASNLEKAIGVIDHRIVCCAFPTGEIAVGDTLIAKTTSTQRPYKGGPIKELQLNNVSFDKISGGSDVKIAIRVEFGVKDNQEFFLLRAADSAGPDKVILETATEKTLLT